MVLCRKDSCNRYAVHGLVTSQGNWGTLLYKEVSQKLKEGEKETRLNIKDGIYMPHYKG